jgi:putative tryptophan/tyrosine transport system substrate-binding protein
MGTRAIVALLIGLTLASVQLAVAQQPGRIFRIGFLDPSTASGMAVLVDAFRQELSKLGWVEGKNIALEYRFGEGKANEHFKELTAELVQIKVDVIVARGTIGALTAKEATSTIPIVMLGVGDPVEAGLIKSLAQPSGNITGLISLSPELITKRVELLKEVVPRLALMGVLIIGGRGSVGTERQIKELEPAAQFLRVKLVYLEAKGEPKSLENAFETAKRQRVDAFTPISRPFAFAERKPIVALAAKHRLPAIYSTREYVDEGGLMSYGLDARDQYSRAAYFVDKILKGTKPADLPVQQPTKFEFIVNLKAAKQIGLTIPPNVLARADRVIR